MFIAPAALQKHLQLPKVHCNLPRLLFHEQGNRRSPFRIFFVRSGRAFCSLLSITTKAATMSSIAHGDRKRGSEKVSVQVGTNGSK
jgi:hypothetical protein